MNPGRRGLGAQKSLGVPLQFRHRRHVREYPAVGTAKFQLPVGQALHLESLFMHRAMVAPAEQRQVRQRRGPTIRPVLDVMPLSEPRSAPREAAAVIPILQRPP